MDGVGSIVFAILHQCDLHLVHFTWHLHHTGADPAKSLWVYQLPVMSGHVPCLTLKLPICVWGSGSPSHTWFPGPPKSTSQTVDWAVFSWSCQPYRPHYFVIGRIWLVLWCGLIIRINNNSNSRMNNDCNVNNDNNIPVDISMWCVRGRCLKVTLSRGLTCGVSVVWCLKWRPACHCSTASDTKHVNDCVQL